MAEQVGVIVTANDVSTCHRLPGRGKGAKLLVAKLVRRDAKHQLMDQKNNLKETSIHVIENFNTYNCKNISETEKKGDVRGVLTANEKIIVLM